jgi:hypothetical protein
MNASLKNCLFAASLLPASLLPASLLPASLFAASLFAATQPTASIDNYIRTSTNSKFSTSIPHPIKEH